MRLFFPGGEHPEVELKAGETAVGFDSDGALRVHGESVADQQASLFRGPLGLWLHCDRALTCHLNGRPIHQLAFLRVGDVLTIDRLRIVLKSDRLPGANDAPSTVESPLDSDDAALAALRARQVLRGLSGHCAGQTFSLADALVIGSGAGCQVQLSEPEIAAQWIRIEHHGQQLRARTLASGNPFEVNGWRMETAALLNGDQLVCGAHRFIVELPDLPPADAPVDRDARPPAAPPEVPAKSASSAVSAGWWLVLVAAAVAVVTTVLLL